MLCQVCASIDFRPLHECNRKAEEINDKSNAAFRWLHTSEACFEKWKQGDGTVHVYYFHHAGPLKLIQSARDGCRLCAIMAFTLFDGQIVLEEGKLQLPVAPNIRQPVVLMLFLHQGCGSWRNAGVYESINVFCGPLHGRLDSLDHTMSDHYFAPDESLKHCDELEVAWENGDIQSYLSTWSLANADLALSWYTLCKERHYCCQIEFAYLPKRVIDLGEPASDANPMLVEPPAQTHAEYVTLSYCWGDKHQALDYGFGARDPDSLELPPLVAWPQLFRDTIEVTRAFGIRYLWIDVVCIIQTLRGDWEIESAKMAQYYQNSAFTIAAVSARSSSQSLFGLRNPLLTYPHHLILTPPPEQSGAPAFERYLCAGSDQISGAEFEQDSQESPLHARGWVLQEQLLSTRLLRFGSKRIYWQCRGGKRSESMLVNHTSGGDMNLLPLHMKVDLHHGAWARGRNMVYETWYDILTNLNARNLTYKNDILPAISGVAQTLQAFLDEDQGDYLAGVWRHDLVIGLLWCRGPNHENRAAVALGRLNYHGDDFHAPSWSWISMCHKRLSFKLHPKILTPYGVLLREFPKTYQTSAGIEVQDPAAPFGRVESGILKFSAQCPHITVFLDKEPTIKDPGGVEFRGHGYDLVPIFDLEMPRSGFDSKDWYLGGTPGEPFSGECILDRDEGEFGYEKDAVGTLDNVRGGSPWQFLNLFHTGGPRVLRGIMLPLLHYKTEAHRKGLPEDRILGLALIQVPETSSTCRTGRRYRRIGRVAVNIDRLRWSCYTLPMEEIAII